MGESLSAPASERVSGARLPLAGADLSGGPAVPASDCGVRPSVTGTGLTDCDNRTRYQSRTVVGG
ncbi:MAG: hypothetical protein J07HX64_00401 [halophilic archaeon J07HX64]|nr:MAG: hypothetical protein J07HX64_00401 [halophilic archaeon J07HX64]